LTERIAEGASITTTPLAPPSELATVSDASARKRCWLALCGVVRDEFRCHDRPPIDLIAVKLLKNDHLG